MRNLWREGRFEILSDNVGSLSSSKEMNLLIKRCGTVSHQSWKTSKKTPEEFIEMIWKIRHYSVLEHSWFSISFPVKNRGEKNKILLELLSANHLFCITTRKIEIIVSGNARMWAEAYFRKPSIITATILNYLHSINPILFPFVPKKELISNQLSFSPQPELKTKEEVLVHRAMTVLFSKISRGFTHENVRSRNGHNKVASYTQRSTRYVDPLKKESFNLVLPLNKELPEKVVIFNKKYTLQDVLIFFANLYRSLRKTLKPEEARQWLPIGIETEIAQTMNCAEWLHWFIIRTQKPAHPEIRFVACNLLREVQKRIPQVFENFVFHKGEEGLWYTEYKAKKEEKFLI